MTVAAKLDLRKNVAELFEAYGTCRKSERQGGLVG